MRTLINIILILGLASILLAAGFRLGVDFVQNFDFSLDYVGRNCAFYQDKYKKNFALVICGDGTWWNATPFYQIWDNPL